MVKNQKQKGNKTNPYKFIDLFAGIGGFRLAFEVKQFKEEEHSNPYECQCVFSSEIDKYACKTYEANFRENPENDITLQDANSIEDHDILLAGFPCQAFSNAGKKEGMYDTRGTLFFDIQRILVAKKPKAFILENVKQLKSNDSGNTLRIIKSVLKGDDVNIPDNLPIGKNAREALKEKLNYEISVEVLSAHEYGIPEPVPQKRERVFIVGFLKDGLEEKGLNPLSHFKWPDTRPLTKKVGSILEKGKDKKYFEEFQISEKLWKSHQLRKERNLRAGKGFGFSKFTRKDLFTRTLSARYYKDGSEILIDQEKGENVPPRMLTPRECANLQGYPEDYVLPEDVSKTQLYKQFGNSVSVPLIRALALEVLSTLNTIEGLRKKI